MLHWDEELERRLAPLRAKREEENRRIAELEERLHQASFELQLLRRYLRQAEEENRRLRVQVGAMALGGAGLAEVKGILEEAWLELVLHASPQAERLGALIQAVERLLAETPRPSEPGPPPPAP
ncbi:hypothetical protein [Thermus islandicus]|uniref:hypothetical protein n=1 Tax=Thermus islandicus TaxID=540988 RepID=UPI0003B36F7B|nr:hypothetical protein [Thermus islandicus]